jgi:S-adenosylmethionine decarboxylase
LNINYSTRGTEIAADLWDFDNPEQFDDVEVMEKLMRDALKVENIEPVGVEFKKFTPYGLTMMMLLQESHFNIHLYTESSFLAVSLYTCGSADTNKIIDYFISQIQPKDVHRQTLIRGVR